MAVGNILAVYVVWYGSPSDFVSIVDNLGNTYNSVDTVDFANDGHKSFYAKITRGGACTITVTLRSRRTVITTSLHTKSPAGTRWINTGSIRSLPLAREQTRLRPAT